MFIFEIMRKCSYQACILTNRDEKKGEASHFQFMEDKRRLHFLLLQALQLQQAALFQLLCFYWLTFESTHASKYILKQSEFLKIYELLFRTLWPTHLNISLCFGCTDIYPLSKSLDSKQSTKGHERIIRDILRRSGYFKSESVLYFLGINIILTYHRQNANGSNEHGHSFFGEIHDQSQIDEKTRILSSLW